MKPTNTLNTLRCFQNKIRLIRAIQLYKLKFEELTAEEERSTRLELSDFDLLQEEMEEHILALTIILKFLKEGKSEKENQKAIKGILSQLPQITREMHLFVKSLDTHSQNSSQWLKTIAPEIPQKNIHLYRPSTAASQKKSTTSSRADNQNKFPQESKEEKEKMIKSFKHYSYTLQLIRNKNTNIQLMI